MAAIGAGAGSSLLTGCVTTATALVGVEAGALVTGASATSALGFPLLLIVAFVSGRQPGRLPASGRAVRLLCERFRHHHSLILILTFGHPLQGVFSRTHLLWCFASPRSPAWRSARSATRIHIANWWRMTFEHFIWISCYSEAERKSVELESDNTEFLREGRPKSPIDRLMAP